MTFSPTNSESAPNIAFDRSAHWFKIDITNKLETTQWLLEIAYAPLDQIDFYLQEPDGTIIHKVSGDHYPIADRDLLHRQPIFAFEILPERIEDHISAGAKHFVCSGTRHLLEPRCFP